jgi:hydroxymethylpyrimidine/phosphomethylpyrimidine kinase
MSRRRVLVVAGTDSGGGAGIAADLRALHALGLHASTVVTAVTAQNSLGVQGVWPLPPAAIAAQLTSVLTDIGADAVKTGMLARARTVHVVADRLAELAVPVVVDPVAGAQAGGRLVDDAGLRATRSRLLPLATVVTPNLREAGLLTGRPVGTRRAAAAAARELAGMGPDWALVTGGHLRGEPVDLLSDGEQVIELVGPRVRTRHTHGSGCTLASALAGLLATGLAVPAAAAEAKRFATAAIRAGYAAGKGVGPVGTVS